MRKLNYLTLLIFSMAAMFLFACTKNGEKPASSKYFPNDVGDSWQYNVTDSGTSTPNNPSPPIHYVVNVTITGIVRLLDGKNAAVWQYQWYPGGNDTNYVRLTGDTVKIFDKDKLGTLRGLNFPDLIFLVPLQVNEHWNGKLYNIDSAKVINRTDITTAGPTFTNCYDIYRHYSGPNIELNDHYIFKPFVGMVSKNFVDFQMAPTLYESWQLKSFYVH